MASAPIPLSRPDITQREIDELLATIVPTPVAFGA